ncbi:MAG: hypothetical protein E7425_12660 [Ruminococcaceae bacterium]|nr:hypothetical protein [Oscillospiraceae bacterium]
MKTRKPVSILLILALVLGILPCGVLSARADAAVFALADGIGGNGSGNGVLTRMEPVAYQAWIGSAVADAEPCTSYTVVTSGDTVWSTGWYVVNGNLENTNRITVSDTVNLILCDNAALSAKKGIAVASGNTLNVYAQSAGETTGALVIDDVDAENAGVGGTGKGDVCGAVNIHGGTVSAKSGLHSSGIGGCGVGGSAELAGGVLKVDRGDDSNQRVIEGGLTVAQGYTYRLVSYFFFS